MNVRVILAIGEVCNSEGSEERAHTITWNLVDPHGFVWIIRGHLLFLSPENDPLVTRQPLPPAPETRVIGASSHGSNLNLKTKSKKKKKKVYQGSKNLKTKNEK